MYIWVVLATFLAMLASYVLSPRSDIREVTVEPLAEAQLAKIITKHQAAQKYARYRKRPYTSSSDPELVEYKTGVLSVADVIPYLPHGYVHDANFESQIFCMNENMTVSYSKGGGFDPCSVVANTKMAVTYGAIPLRWLNQGTNLEEPTTDFMNAMRSIVEGGTEFGYTAPVMAGTSTVKNISNSNVRIIDRDRDDMYVPKAIVNDPNYKRVCDVSKGWICLVYITRI